LDVVIVGALGIVVAHHHGNGATKGDSVGYARKDLDVIGFGPGGGQRTLTGSSPSKGVLDAVGVEEEAWGTAVNHNANANSMTFAKGHDAESLTEGA
jgi:hypothetical protein